MRFVKGHSPQEGPADGSLTPPTLAQYLTAAPVLFRTSPSLDTTSAYDHTMEHVEDVEMIPGTEIMKDHDGLHFQRGAHGKGPV